MKRLTLLTSILTLAACGGGSGGGSGGGAALPDVRVPNTTVTSNQKVTSMVSEILIAQDGSANLERSSKTVHHNGKEYKQYRMDNVTFLSADKEFSTDPDEDFMLQFKTDEHGKIIAIHSIDDGEREDFARHGDENRFDVPDEEVHAKLNMLGQQLKLRYSDFGYVEVYQNSDPDNAMFIMPIAGGYDVKKVAMNADELRDDVTFDGIAVLNVGEASTEVAGERLSLRDENAKVTFHKGTGDEVMTANFDKWYDVTATKYADNTAQIVFTDGDAIVSDAHRFRDTDTNTTLNAYDTGRVANDKDEHKVSVNFDYYGNQPNNPSEATGIIYYMQEYGPNQADKVDVYMGFGGKTK